MDSQDAELAALKCDVMTGWDEARRVPSKAAMNCEMRIWAKMSQKRAGEDSPRKMVEVVEEVLLRRGRRGERSLEVYLIWELLVGLRMSSSSGMWLIVVSVSESGPDST